MEEKTGNSFEGILPDINAHQFSDGKWQRSPVSVPREMSLAIFINGRELVTSLCTPTKLNCLALGYLYSEGVISGMGDVAAMRVCQDESLVDVIIKKSDFTLPERRVLTSGCGGGVTFDNVEEQKVVSAAKVTPEQILSLMKQLLQRAEIYRASGGVHTSALCEAEQILVLAEDIGRHNTLDKILGECLLRKLETRDRVLLTTGRLSSEMLRKAARMQVPVVASLTSPTARAISLAEKLDITVIGYVRGSSLTVYTHPERVKGIEG